VTCDEDINHKKQQGGKGAGEIRGRKSEPAVGSERAEFSLKGRIDFAPLPLSELRTLPPAPLLSPNTPY
jgi:hypothetical protein